jgi:hypothetical protein
VKRRFGCALVALVLAAAVARADEGARPGGAGPGGAGPGGVASGGPGPDDGRGRREEAFRIVDAYVVSHLQESLALGDEQYVKVLPLVTKLQGDRRDFFLARGRVIREMRHLLRAGGGSEAELVGKLGELKRLESEGPARVKTDSDALDAALTPLQQAKFRLLELEVEQRMRELMGRARPGGGRGPRN